MLQGLKGQIIDVLDITKPPDINYAQDLAKIVSKLSPIIGNMIEISSVNILNNSNWNGLGKWIRQDPGFPDTLFYGCVDPAPGIEIKTWFPLATEITARFKDSVTHFKKDQVNVALIAWLPEFVLFGRPRIIDVWIGTASSLATARDTHYHRPPDYLVFEPEDTSDRTRNLQQTNTNGYKFQGTANDLEKAAEVVRSWGEDGVKYLPDREYQQKLKNLRSQFDYRLDTNFAKIDRIEHDDIKKFKTNVLSANYLSHSIGDWMDILLNNQEIVLDLLSRAKR